MLADYLADDPQLCSWFAGAWRETTDLLTAPAPLDRARLTAVLTEALSKRAAPSASVAAVNHLHDDQCVLIAGGQQPAFGGGPLLSLVKALECQQRAAELRAAGRPCEALFWIASDDHDHDEANRCDLIHRDGRIERLRCRYDTPGAALHRQEASAGWDQLIQALQAMPDSKLGMSWLLEHAPQTHEGLGSWFARILEQLCPGLIVIES